MVVGREVRRSALQLLLKMTRNVAESPQEAKFRRIKMSSAAGSSELETSRNVVLVKLTFLP